MSPREVRWLRRRGLVARVLTVSFALVGLAFAVDALVERDLELAQAALLVVIVPALLSAIPAHLARRRAAALRKNDRVVILSEAPVVSEAAGGVLSLASAGALVNFGGRRARSLLLASPVTAIGLLVSAAASNDGVPCIVVDVNGVPVRPLRGRIMAWPSAERAA